MAVGGRLGSTLKYGCVGGRGAAQAEGTARLEVEIHEAAWDLEIHQQGRG